MCRYTYLESQGKLTSYVCKRDCHEKSNLHLCFFFTSDLITYIILDEDECSFEDWIANLEKEAEIALLRFVFDRIFSSSTPWASLVSSMIVMDIRWFSPKATTTYKTWGSDLCSVPRQSIFHSSFLLWWSFYACPLPIQSRGCSSSTMDHP